MPSDAGQVCGTGTPAGDAVENAAWLCGPQVLDLPRPAPPSVSHAFSQGGFYVMRAPDDSMRTRLCEGFVVTYAEPDIPNAKSSSSWNRPLLPSKANATPVRPESDT
jgi:hypothetical protein